MSCSGVCCAAFPWNRTPQELRDKPLWSGGSTSTESKFIADMLIPLTPEQAKHRHQRFGVGYAAVEYGRGNNWYTCKHWDEDTKLCGVYDERPQMCRDFPYERECEHNCGYCLSDDDRADYDRRKIEDGYGPLQILLGEN